MWKDPHSLPMKCSFYLDIFPFSVMVTKSCNIWKNKTKNKQISFTDETQVERPSSAFSTQTKINLSWHLTQLLSYLCPEIKIVMQSPPTHLAENHPQCKTCRLAHHSWWFDVMCRDRLANHKHRSQSDICWIWMWMDHLKDYQEVTSRWSVK